MTTNEKQASKEKQPKEAASKAAAEDKKEPAAEGADVTKPTAEPNPEGVKKRSADEAKINEVSESSKAAKKVEEEGEEEEPNLIPAATVGTDTYHDHDVLSGRGGGTNVHPGNRNFRDLINLHRRAYLKARKNDKPAISRAIVKTIRANKGRFLRRDEKAGLWFEIGDDAAREKTSQALRQRAPEMRKLLFDTEQEEARVMAEENFRNNQRMIMTMPAPMIPGLTGQDLAVMHHGNPMLYNPILLQQMAASSALKQQQQLPAPGTPAYQQMVQQLMANNGAPKPAAP